MTERGRSALRRSETTLAIGPSSMVFDGKTLTFQLDERSMPWASPLRGRVRVAPMRLAGQTFALDSAGLHRWSPLAPMARVEVALDAPAVRWTGHGYLDTNSGDVPLESTFRSWQWSRATNRESATIFYDVQPLNGAERCLALKVGIDGAIDDTALASVVALPKSKWGVARSTRGDAGTSARVLTTFEDAPFYARSLVTTQLDGELTTSIHESLSLTRFDTRWVQCLLPFRMPRRTNWPG